MKNALKNRLTVFFLVFCSSFTITSCDILSPDEENNESSLSEQMIGSWTMLRFKANGVTDNSYSGSLVFRADGTGYDVAKYSDGSTAYTIIDQDFDWTLDGSHLTRKWKVDGTSQTQSISVAGDILTISYTVVSSNTNVVIDYH